MPAAAATAKTLAAADLSTLLGALLEQAQSVFFFRADDGDLYRFTAVFAATRQAPRRSRTATGVTAVEALTALLGPTLRKRCIQCGRTKPVTAFARDKSRKDGRNTYCATCSRKRRR